MVTETMKGIIFKYLKDRGASDLNCLSEHNDYNPDEVLDVLETGVREGFLIRDDTGRYRLKIVLDSPIPTTILKEDHHHYDWEEIQRKKDKMLSMGAPVPERPQGSADRTDSPFLKYMPWLMQSERGTCFPGGTRILMEDLSYRKIKDIVVGDYVISHTGEKRLVTDKMKRKWQGTTTKLWVYGWDRPLEATKEHPILTNNGWKPIGEITKNDFVAIPTLHNINGDKTIYKFEKDPEFLWVLGLYMAEGNLENIVVSNDIITSGGRVIFSLHRNETEYAFKVKTTMEKYGAMVTIRERESNGLTVNIAGQKWVDIFRELGGEYCNNKCLSTRMMYLPPELQIEIYNGWCDGDGHVKEPRGTHQIVTTSDRLVRQMQIILMRNHKRGNIQRRTDYENKLPAWCFEISPGNPKYGYFENGLYWVHPRIIEQKQGYTGGHVYNLEVDVDNSYIAESIAVHNCVGHATALLMQANYYSLTGDFPTDVEMKEAKRDILLPIWNNLCSIRYDKWYRTVFSMQWAYYISRVVGNVTVPSGSYCDAAIQAMVKYGCCLWDECLTDKGARCTPQLYSELIPVSDTDWAKWQPQFEPMAFKHKLTGYATIRTFEGLMTAIEQSKGKGVIMPINLELDYMDVEEDGTWKAHPGSTSKAGGHALWWCSVDRINRKVRCLNSWGEDFVKYTWIDEVYYDENAGAAFAAIDDEEVKIGEILYSKVKISSNVPCTYTINGIPQIGDPVSIALERAKNYGIIAVPNNPAQVKEVTMSYDVRPVLDETNVVFSFTVLPVTPTKKTLTQMIVELLKKILAIFGR